MRVRPACFHLAVLAMLAAAGPADAAPSAQTIAVHTEAWADYTERDGSGLAWDILRAVYRPAGIMIEAHFAPYPRAVRDVLDGRGDMWIASYPKEEPDALYPDYHFDADRIQAVFKARYAGAWHGAESLAGARVGWVRGYVIGDYLDVPVDPRLANTRPQGLRMLKHGRIRYFLDAQYELDHVFDDPPAWLDTGALTRRAVTNLPLFMAFDDSARGRRFRRIWDARFPKLLQNGRVAEIYARYGNAVWPFDVPRATAEP